MEMIQQRPLMVGLKRLHFRVEFFAQAAQPVVDFGERRPSVDVGLTAPQQVEVGAVEDEDLQAPVALGHRGPSVTYVTEGACPSWYSICGLVA